MTKDVKAINEDEYTDLENAKFKDVVQDYKKPLYDGCNMSLLHAMLKLLTIKVNNCWSDQSFTALLQLLEEMPPKGNVVPLNTYEAKKMSIGIGSEKIHACKEHCIAFYIGAKIMLG